MKVRPMHYYARIAIADPNALDADILNTALQKIDGVSSVEIRTPSDKNLTKKDFVAMVLISVAGNYATDLSKEVTDALQTVDWAEVLLVEPVPEEEHPQTELPDTILPRKEDD